MPVGRSYPYGSDLGCYGNADVRTPHLDRFSEQALRFNRCFNWAPMCSPLRQSLYTGLYPVRNGAYPNHSRVYEGVRSLPHFLKPLGYRSALIGKRHEAPLEAFPFEFLGGRHHDGGRGIDLDIGKAEAFLREAAADEDPFCKWTCYAMGIRSAALIRWPGQVEPASQTDFLMSYVDIVPTLMELAGGDPGTLELDGQSFAPLPLLHATGNSPQGTEVQGKGPEANDNAAHRYVYAVQTSRGIYHGPEAYGIRSVTDGRYLLIKNLNFESRFQNLVTAGDRVYRSWKRLAEAGNGFAQDRYDRCQRRTAWELYDLESDPWNLENLAEDSAHQSTRRRLTTALDQWMQQQGDRGIQTELNAEERQVDR